MAIFKSINLRTLLSIDLLVDRSSVKNLVLKYLVLSMLICLSWLQKHSTSHLTDSIIGVFRWTKNLLTVILDSLLWINSIFLEPTLAVYLIQLCIMCFPSKKEKILPLKRLFWNESSFGFSTYGLLEPQKPNWPMVHIWQWRVQSHVRICFFFVPCALKILTKMTSE